MDIEKLAASEAISDIEIAKREFAKGIVTLSAEQVYSNPLI